jgi:hypothetical protein
MARLRPASVACAEYDDLFDLAAPVSEIRIVSRHGFSGADGNAFLSSAP